MSSNTTEYSASWTYSIFCILFIVTGVWFMWIVGYNAMKAVIALITAVILIRKIRNQG